MDELKKVYVVVGRGYTTERVRKEIKEEGYNFSFNFTGPIELMFEADEVWLFGDCSEREEYKEAVDKGCEIWDMSA
jgi:hypothetical protein